MATSSGYNSRRRGLDGPSLKLSDFLSKGYSSTKKEFTEADKKSFYQTNMHDAKRTVLLCDLQLTLTAIDDPVTGKLISTSGEGKHAEQVFMGDMKKFLSKKTTSGSNLESVCIKMLINYSPCFKCREELQHYFTTELKGKEVTFILRIGYLHRGGHQTDEAERKLAFWKKDLEMQGVKVYLEAINVVNELPTGTNAAIEKRKELDEEIQQHIENIETRYTDVKRLLRSINSKNRKKHFVTENGEQMILGELIVSAFTHEQSLRPTTAIKLPKITADKHGKLEEEHIIAKARSSMPESWRAIWKSLLLVCVRVPSRKCLNSVANFLIDKTHSGKKNQMVLYLANIPAIGDEHREALITWIKYLEVNSIDVCLEPVYTSLSSRNRTEQERYTALDSKFQALRSDLESWSSYPNDQIPDEDMSWQSDDLPPIPLTPPFKVPLSPPGESPSHDLSSPIATPQTSLTPEGSPSVISISSEEVSPIASKAHLSPQTPKKIDIPIEESNGD